jgi:hypothetical protein
MAFVRCLPCCVQAFAGSYDALLGATAAALAAASTDVQASLEPIKAYSKAKQSKAKQSKAFQCRLDCGGARPCSVVQYVALDYTRKYSAVCEYGEY